MGEVGTNCAAEQLASAAPGRIPRRAGHAPRRERALATGERSVSAEYDVYDLPTLVSSKRLKTLDLLMPVYVLVLADCKSAWEALVQGVYLSMLHKKLSFHVV